MGAKTSNQLYNQWESSWKRDKKHNLTWVGKLTLRFKQKALKEILNITKPSMAIDVGCGLGYTLLTFDRVGIKAIGIDVSPTAIKVCQDKGLNAVQKKMEEVADRYDFVFSDGLLEHFLNFEPYAQHLMRISSRYVCLIQPDHESFSGKTLVYFRDLLKGSKNIFEYNYRIKDFISIFEKYGFKLVLERSVCGRISRLLLFQET